MKRVMLIGQSFSGKTTLLQKINGQTLSYQKTQALQCENDSIDTPGEYLENRALVSALLTTSYDAEVIALVQSATAPLQLFSPMFARVFTKPVIGVITKADAPDAKIDAARAHLTLAGAEPIFITSAYTGEGIQDVIDFLT